MSPSVHPRVVNVYNSLRSVGTSQMLRKCRVPPRLFFFTTVAIEILRKQITFENYLVKYCLTVRSRPSSSLYRDLTSDHSSVDARTFLKILPALPSKITTPRRSSSRSIGVTVVILIEAGEHARLIRQIQIN